MSLTLGKSTQQINNIKVGFEYEGVIKNNQNQILTFDQLSPSAKKNIMGFAPKSPFFNDNNPYDRYNCLAELKTEPFSIQMDSLTKENFYDKLIVNKQNIFYSLFCAIGNFNNLFLRNGYMVDWKENLIPDERHFLILSQMEKETETIIKQDNKYTNKTVFTLDKKNNIIPWTSIDNKYRGGGLHITISGDNLEENINVEFIKKLHARLYYSKNPMKSIYRTNLLFREKKVNDLYLFEYMSFGLQLEQNIPLSDFVYRWQDQSNWLFNFLDVLLNFALKPKK